MQKTLAPNPPLHPETERLPDLKVQTFTLHTGRSSCHSTPPSPPPPAHPKRTVLIVDDEEAVRTLVRVLVERRDAQALLASDGVEALKIYAAHSAEIGVILTDIHMPNLNGLGLIRTLRAKGAPPPVVVMCGQLDENLLAALTAENVACVLPKPFQIAEFEAVIALLPAPVATA
ncbi:MAG: response regulator [Opitutaceae bacterium]|nr:response regulator [Opitutaceae bacterium]